jgi:hypothetical protein
MVHQGYAWLGIALSVALGVQAQNSPLSGLAPRGAVQASDIIPIMPAGGAQLMQTTVGAIIAPASAGATGTVQSVNLNLPGAFTCTGGPITASGTISCALANESANSFLAGPASGGAAAPSFRAIQIADLFGGAGASSSTFLRGDGAWATAGAGSVTSVGLSLPTIFAVSGSPVTGSGTLMGALVSEMANAFFAAPNGSSGTPTFRLMATADLPASGVTAGVYVSPNSVTVNSAGQVTGIVGNQLCIVNSCAAPLLSTFTWVNPGSASASQPIANGPIALSLPDSGSTCCTWRGIFQSVTACPWKVTAALQASVPTSNNVDLNGLYLYNGTKLIGFELEETNSGYIQRIEHITNVTTDGSTPWNSASGWSMRNDYNGIIFEQIRDDCTNYYFDSSVNGVTYYTLYQEAVGSYMTATEVGYGGDQSQGATSPLLLSLTNWVPEPDANLNGP